MKSPYGINFAIRQVDPMAFARQIPWSEGILR